jgi:hypothetical protein
LRQPWTRWFWEWATVMYTHTINISCQNMQSLITKWWSGFSPATLLSVFQMCFQSNWHKHKQ